MNFTFGHKKVLPRVREDDYSSSFNVAAAQLLQQRGFSCLKKSLPLSSTRMKAGKSSTSIFQMASMPSSGYSTHSMLLMLDCERTAATPPMLPR